MSAVLRSPEDIANAALGRVGWKKRIGSLYDGSVASKLVLDSYGQTRDEILRSFEWGFAENNVSLTLLKTAPVGGYSPIQPWTTAFPILPWIFEYQYPDNMLFLRSLRTSASFIPEFDPKPTVFRIANDNSYSPSRKVILCNSSDAIAVYTGQVTDPSLWDADFTEAMIAALARRLAPALANLEAEKMEAQDEAVSKEEAEMRVG